jgi:hypothetical protein
MTTSPRPATVRSSLRRGLGAASAAVVVAFIGTGAMTPAQAQAAGLAPGLRYAAEPAPAGPRPAAHPANLPPATTVALRYRVVDGELLRLPEE